MFSKRRSRKAYQRFQSIDAARVSPLRELGQTGNAHDREASRYLINFAKYSLSPKFFSSYPTLGSNTVTSTVRVLDEADQFRIEIEGRLAGETVIHVRRCWRSALFEPSLRKLTIDISQLTGYDRHGFKLLREMYAHGTCISARNAEALTILHEISSRLPAGPAIVPSSVNPPAAKEPGKALVTPFPLARAAGAGK